MEVRVLGPLEVIGPSGLITIAGSRQRAILALLALDLGRSVASERLVDEIWGDEPPPSALHALRVHIAGLRRTLGAAHIRTEPGGYRLAPEGVTVDLHRFEELVAGASRALAAGDPNAAAAGFRDALALWRGPALADLAGEHAAGPQRAHMDDLRWLAHERQVNAELASGHHVEIIPELRRLVAEAPFRETLQARLMLALYRAGRQAEALEVYRQSRVRLDRELGVVPGPELEAMQRAVLGHDADLDMPHPPSPAVTIARPSEGSPAEVGGDELEAVITTRRLTRRTVTVLVAMGGSPPATIGQPHDPEAERQAPADVLDLLRPIVEGYGGTVEPLVGGAAMAVFGLPTGHEDDGLRAARAALALRDAVATGSGGPAIGLVTGEIVVGETAGAAALAAGDLVSVASEVARAASPGAIVLAESTYQLLRHTANLRSSGSIVPFGRTAAMAMYELQDLPASVDGHPPRLDSPLVGRERELRQLLDALEQTIEDEGCSLFTLLGPAGVGKSRLTHEFLRVVHPDALVLRGRCQPYGEQAGFGPIAEQVRQAAGISEADPWPVARGKIEALVADEERAAVISERISSLIGASAAPSGGDDTPWAIRSFFEGLARRHRPLVLVFDDIQWGEPAFLDLVEYLAGASRDAPILLLCIARPELLDTRPTWGGGKRNATSVLLRPLDEDEVSLLVGNLLGGRPAPALAERRITDAAEGNPLFVEEFLAMLIDDGVVRRHGDEWVTTSDLASVAVPASIMALLAARLDQLPPAERDTLERAAVIGKVFDRRALDALSAGQGAAELESSLGSLVSRELLRRDRPDPSGAQPYRFKHILIRDAAYAGVPKRARIALHERLADWFAAAGEQRAALGDELIGAHLEQAYRYRTELGPPDERTEGVGRMGARRLAVAGQRARNIGDVQLAEGLLERAIALLPADDPARLRLLSDLADVRFFRGEWAAARQASDELAQGAERLGSEDLRWRARLDHMRLDFYAAAAGPLPTIEIEAAIRHFAAVGDEQAQGMGWRLIGDATIVAGHYASARAAYDRAAKHARHAGDIPGEARARVIIATADMDGPATVRQAMRTATGLVDWARATGQSGTEAIALAHVGRLRAMLGDFAEARRLVGESVALNLELGRTIHGTFDVPRWVATVEWLAGDPVAAEIALRRGLEQLERQGFERYGVSFIAIELCRMLCLQGRYDEAFQLIPRAENPSWNQQAEINWRGVRALIAVRRGDFVAAHAFANDAVAIANETDMLWHHGRALEDLAEVLSLSGMADEAEAVALRAIGLYERKGITVLAERARLRLVKPGASRPTA